MKRLIWIMIFIGCIFSLLLFVSQNHISTDIKSYDLHSDWQKAKAYLDTLEHRPTVIIAIYFGLIITLLGIVIVILLGIMVIPVKPKEIEAGKEERKEKYPEIKTRGRSRY